MQDAINGQGHRSVSPWNRGKLIRPKPPLKAKEIWSIRIRVQVAHCVRDLALFNLALDSRMQARDLVVLRVDDVALNERVRCRATVLQRKTGRPVQFEITEHTVKPLDNGWRRRMRTWASRCSPAGSTADGR